MVVVIDRWLLFEDGCQLWCHSTDIFPKQPILALHLYSTSVKKITITVLMSNHENMNGSEKKEYKVRE